MSKQDYASNGARPASIEVAVRDGAGAGLPIPGAWIALYFEPSGAAQGKVRGLTPDTPPLQLQRTDATGHTTFSPLQAAAYRVGFLHAPYTLSDSIAVHAGCAETVCLSPRIGATIDTKVQSRDCKPVDCRPAQRGDHVLLTASNLAGVNATRRGTSGGRVLSNTETMTELSYTLKRTGPQAFGVRFGLAAIGAALPLAGSGDAGEGMISIDDEFDVEAPEAQPVSGQLGVALTRTETEATEDLPLWVAIRNGTDALSFNNYLRYMDLLFCRDRQGSKAPFTAEEEAFARLKAKRFLPFTDSDSYRVLKAATEAFVMVNCAVLNTDDPGRGFQPRRDNAYLDRRDLPAFDDLRGSFKDYLKPSGGLLPYLALVRRKLPDIPVVDVADDEANLCVGFVQDKLVNPCLVELIWSYWHEEAMLVQTMNAVTRRFQNRRSPGTPDPLANLEIDPLRPLSNLIWGYTQDEQHRLTVNRRNYEYDHHYGLRLHGKAVQEFRPADTRSQFLEAFHHLLRLCTVFYKQDDDTTVKADAFPVLNALKEVHLVMSQGAHNQFGDLPSTARIEMLMQQWLLGRPEFREFLPTRIMVAYPEPWMDRVDAMKKMQGWTDTSVVHFRNLAIFGEQVMLSIRYGAWSEVYEPTQAFNWARFWRPQLQGYIHAYRAATGIDLSGETSDAKADATLPSVLMHKRLAQQQRSA